MAGCQTATSGSTNKKRNLVRRWSVTLAQSDNTGDFWNFQMSWIMAGVNPTASNYEHEI